jgi:preprotein translocase subunit SecG
MGCKGCLFRAVLALVVLWIVTCLVVNVMLYGKPLPGLGM